MMLKKCVHNKMQPDLFKKIILEIHKFYASGFQHFFNHEPLLKNFLLNF